STASAALVTLTSSFIASHSSPDPGPSTLSSQVALEDVEWIRPTVQGAAPERYIAQRRRRGDFRKDRGRTRRGTKGRTRFGDANPPAQDCGPFRHRGRPAPFAAARQEAHTLAPATRWCDDRSVRRPRLAQPPLVRRGGKTARGILLRHIVRVTRVRGVRVVSGALESNRSGGPPTQTACASDVRQFDDAVRGPGPGPT